MTVNAVWTSAAAGGTLDLSNGQVVTEAVWDALVSNFNHLGGTVGYIGAAAIRGSSQSISHNTTTAVTLTTEDFDSGSLFTATSAQITVPVDGKYLLVAYVQFASNSTGYRGIEIFASAATRALVRLPAVNGDVTALSVAHVMTLGSTATVEVRALQTSGGALNVEGAALGVIKV